MSAQQTTQQKASRHCDTHRRYGVLTDITAATFHQLLLGFFQWVAAFAKCFRSLTGCIGDLIVSFMCGMGYFVCNVHGSFLFYLSLFESHVILDGLHAADAACHRNRFVNIGAGIHKAA